MRIGEFAAACGTKISVLRHYDKEGLLAPDMIDRFTGYRYYTPEQADVFLRIAALKKAGFSLKEIRALLPRAQDKGAVLAHIGRKKAELEEALSHLDEAKELLLGGKTMTQAKWTPLHEDIAVPFEDDARVIGKWQVVGEYAAREDFDGQRPGQETTYGDIHKEIYFLSGGKPYWCYGWTKGFLIWDDGVETALNRYEVEAIDEVRYMFIQNKGYDYKRGGKPTLLVLRQLDQRAYTSREIARTDDIDKPFVPDSRVLGKWLSVAFCDRWEAFTPDCEEPADPWYFESITFEENGRCTSVFRDDVITSPEDQTWTRGFLLRRYNSTACAYDIRRRDGTEYLVMEWKSGDYRWGGHETDYYVFKRADA